MSELTTEHRGYAIRYSENEDVWRCPALNVDAPLLSKVKEKINKVLLKAAKARTAAPAMYIGHSHEVIEVAITSYAGLAYGDIKDQPHVWTVREDHRSGRQRNKHPVTRVLLDNPENREWAAELTRLRDAASAAQKAVSDYRKSAPHVTVDALVAAGIISEGTDDE